MPERTKGLMRRLQRSKLTYKIVSVIVRKKTGEHVILLSFIFILDIHISNHWHCCFTGPGVLWVALLKRLESRLGGGCVPPVAISTRESP